MENQCGVKYIFQSFESRTVLQPILANSKGDGDDPKCSYGTGWKGQASVYYCPPPPRCGPHDMK